MHTCTYVFIFICLLLVLILAGFLLSPKALYSYFGLAACVMLGQHLICPLQHEFFFLQLNSLMVCPLQCTVVTFHVPLYTLHAGNAQVDLAVSLLGGWHLRVLCCGSTLQLQ